MFEKLKKHYHQILVFTINGLLMMVIVFLIRESSKDSLSQITTEENSDFAPISDAVISAQDQIATDRENKLRKLNNSPKEIQQEQTTTNTITETIDPVTQMPVTQTAPAKKSAPTTTPTPTKKTTAKKSSSSSSTTTAAPKANKQTKTS